MGAAVLVSRRPMQWREARHGVLRIDVRAAVDQHQSRLEAIVPASVRQRVAEISRLIGIGSMIQQEANHRHIVVISGPHQWRTKARHDISGSRIIRFREFTGLRASVQQ
jgi:hypothetical protein